MAGPDDLAGLTGIYYTLTYAGFLPPTVLVALSARLPDSVMLAAVAVVALVCLVLVTVGGRGDPWNGSRVQRPGSYVSCLTCRTNRALSTDRTP
ncbi:hypothetical protein [Streptomyces sp. NPDC056983]|uniref:hypothetical protein n=1 Tax=Streptomyces sp. NPDC056983 TaxID=3345987 RepID=UPI0036352E82